MHNFTVEYRDRVHKKTVSDFSFAVKMPEGTNNESNKLKNGRKHMAWV